MISTGGKMMDISKFKSIVDSFYKTLVDTPSEKTNIRLSEDKWSLGEIIGHLIDSASNNHQRFVRLQFDDLLGFPAYDGETWIKTQKYIDLDWSVLTALWYNYNSLLLHIIESVDESAYGNVWVKSEEETIPLENLIVDYYKHMELHIEHFNNRLAELK
jgi:hypothetical protein